jgi:2'-5' RNA ligase
MRTFFAIDLPEDILRQLEDFISLCKKIQKNNINYVQRLNLHITLKFLGESEQGQISNLIQELKGKKLKTPDLRIESVGGFPNIFFPKVLWFGVQNRVLKDIFNVVEKAASSYNFPVENREFQPHITLARMKGPADKMLINFLKMNEMKQFGGIFYPERFVLYKSELTTKGPIYNKIDSFDLLD